MRYFLNIKVNVFFLAFGSREPRMTPRVFTYYLVHNFNLGYHTAAGAPVRVYVPGSRKKCPGKYMDGLNAFSRLAARVPWYKRVGRCVAALLVLECFFCLDRGREGDQLCDTGHRDQDCRVV